MSTPTRMPPDSPGLDDPRLLTEPLPVNGRMPRIGVLQAVRRHWPLALLPVVLLTAAGGVLGLAREPNWTATADLAVGKIDLNQPGALAGFALATQSLAASYARAIHADDVVAPAARQVGLTPEEVVARTGASPVPKSPIVRVKAVGDADRQTTALANAMSASLQAYTEKLNDHSDEVDAAYDRYVRAAGRVAFWKEEVDDANEAYNDVRSSERRETLLNARTRYAVARARAANLERNYEETDRAGSGVSELQQLTAADSADSDRRARLQLFVLTGLIVGGLVGVVLATWRADRVLRRRLR